MKYYLNVNSLNCLNIHRKYHCVSGILHVSSLKLLIEFIIVKIKLNYIRVSVYA